jgi:tyrosyl-tRNA synthetase
MDVLADLDARGLLHDTTSRDALAARLEAGPITLYYGCDPTADSLHVGNLVGLLVLRRFQLAGHRPIALAGGATGMVGDPSGRSAERNLLDAETLAGNVAAIKAQIAGVLGPGDDWELVDNLDWTAELGLLEFLRAVGKHATVNQMLARESVKARLATEQGISFTEFTYMLLQANDYRHLYERHRCELQVGGSDQWGNILSGVDLIRRASGEAVHALCWPLLTAPDGSKLGKTTGARIWLSADRTSPFELYQHFLQVEDLQVRQQLCWFTMLPVAEIDEIVAAHLAAPERRDAQRRLAFEATALVHGRDEAEAAAAGTARWSDDLSAEAFEAREGEFPTTYLGAGTGPVVLVDLLVRTGLAPSKGAGRRLVSQRGVRVNGHVVTDADAVYDPVAFVEGRWLLLGVGKRNRHVVVLGDPG